MRRPICVTAFGPPTVNARRLHHCRDCGKETPQSFLRTERCDVGIGGEAKPQPEYWGCNVCGMTLLTLADLPDAEGLCRDVLRRRVVRRVHDYGDTHSLEYEERLAELEMELWDCYRRWNPGQGVRFRAYASWILAARVVGFDRKRGGRNGEKPLANAVSLDAPSDLVVAGTANDAGDHLAYGAGVDADGRRLDERVATLTMDRDEHSLAGYLGAVTRRSREIADVEAGFRAERGMDRRAAQGAA